MSGGEVMISMAGMMVNCKILKIVPSSLAVSASAMSERVKAMMMYQHSASQVKNCPRSEIALVWRRFFTTLSLKFLETLFVDSACS